MQNETVGPAQPEPIVAESETLQEIRRTKKEIEEGVRHLDHVDPARVRAMMKTFDLLIAVHLRNPTCAATLHQRQPRVDQEGD